jgi:hypothetical protein
MCLVRLHLLRLSPLTIYKRFCIGLYSIRAAHFRKFTACKASFCRLYYRRYVIYKDSFTTLFSPCGMYFIMDNSVCVCVCVWDTFSSVTLLSHHSLYWTLGLVARRSWVKEKLFRYRLTCDKRKRAYSSYSFLTSALDGERGQRHASTALYNRKRTSGNHWIRRRLGESQGRSGHRGRPWKFNNITRAVYVQNCFAFNPH